MTTHTRQLRHWSDVTEPYSSAAEVRRRNVDLDGWITGLVERVPERHLHDALPEGQWTLAEHLGHLAEFPATFSRQLDEWLRGERAVVGRVADYDTDRLDALVRATERRRAGLVAELATSLGRMVSVLARFTDDHLTAHVQDVTEGRVPLIRILDRYVLGHKQVHAESLAAALADL